MSTPLSLAGTIASPGYVEGPLHALSEGTAAHSRMKGSSPEEAEALNKALAATAHRIAMLMARVDEASASILEFQLAMIEDEALAAPALSAIAEGIAADAAWRAALDMEIAGYETSDNAYFRARAADLKDIRDQVLQVLTDAGSTRAPGGAILFGEDIAPTRFLEIDWSKGGGIALFKGSPASHVAMLARARGVPMVVGLERAAWGFGNALLDGEEGRIIFHPSKNELAAFRISADGFVKRREREHGFLKRRAVTGDGTSLRVLVNIADPSETDYVDIATCDGVGLMRTEFLFSKGLPGEEEQYRAYRKVLEWAADKPVTIRTVDAGGDKPVEGFTVEETNPFLGLRGIRLSLARPEIFRVQVRALLRAAVHGNLKVMVPMISTPEELDHVEAILADEANGLESAHVPHRMPPLGIMVEVPAVAIAPEGFVKAAFFSIGSNDLTQYVMAAARDNGAVSRLNTVQNPAVMRLIAGVAEYCARSGVLLSLCGDAGGDPAAIPALLFAGLRDLSVAPAQLAAAKAAIAEVTLS